MPLVPYAHAPRRRAWQVLGDVLLLVWVASWVRAGLAVRDATMALAGPGRRIEEGGTGVAGSMAAAAEAADGVPLLGDELAAPFLSAGEAAGQIAAAGRRQVEVVTDLAGLLGLVVAAVPVLVGVLLWVPPRVRFARRAGAARAFAGSDADLRLFALRAIAHQPMHRLTRVSADPVTAWERGDPEVVRRLASLELADAGLRPPLARSAT